MPKDKTIQEVKAWKYPCEKLFIFDEYTGLLSCGLAYGHEHGDPDGCSCLSGRNTQPITIIVNEGH